MKTRPRLRNLLFGVYVVLCLGAVCRPGYAWLGGSIEPYVLGLPFSLAWVVGWVVMTLLVLLVYNATLKTEHDTANHASRQTDRSHGNG